MAEGTYLVFVTRPTGYVLTERKGEPPAAGSAIELEDEGGGSFSVAKVASSPLPGDERRCAYLVPA